MKNSKVKAARQQAGTTELAESSDHYDHDKEASKARQQRFVALGLDKASAQFRSLPDRVAQSDHWIKNEPIPHGLDLFPPEQNLWYMRYSDLFYAHAKGGPLYIDTPRSTTEVMYCEQKLIKYLEKKVRYTYIKAGDDEIDVLLRLDPLALPQGEVVA